MRLEKFDARSVPSWRVNAQKKMHGKIHDHKNGQIDHDRDNGDQEKLNPKNKENYV